MCHRADGAGVADGGVGDEGIILDLYVVSDRRINDANARADRAVSADDGFAFDSDVLADSRVAAYRRFGTDIGGSWIDEGNAALEHKFLDSSAT
ncbi:MAG TPA: hypothetical protein PLP07_15315, partial [Pyrinomonadaceae bacterium]|nr:hypothetical protein [Pyrinomonadaceae bacterium]